MTQFRLETINDVLRIVRERDMPNVAVRRVGTEWRNVTARELLALIGSLAKLLRSWGVKHGDRVAIIAENRLEWALTDFACLALGAVDVPIYPTLTAEQSRWILQDADVRIVFVSTRAQATKAAEISREYPLERIVCMDDLSGELGTTDFWSSLSSVGTPDESELHAVMASVKPDDLATIIYTSGTTGTPKGVMLTHGNIASNLSFSCHDFGWGVGWRSVSFLPLSHITARHVDYLFFLYGVMIAYCPDINLLFAAFQENKPSVVVAVPRVFEKIRQEATRKAAGFPKKQIFDRAIRTGAKYADEVIAGREPQALPWKIADRLVLHKIRDAFGGEAQQFISGGAPLGRDTALWYAGVGIRIMEGYGLTETSPVISVNTADAYRLGTVGRPLENVDCRIAEDGELLVRGPSVFKGYWRNAEESAQSFDGDWFKTGDIGNIDQDGFLSITDRKKDLIKTSGGKFIAPQPIEGKFKTDAMIAHPVVIGDRRKFAIVLIQPNWPMLEEWARQNDIPYADRRELVAHPDVMNLYQRSVNSINRDLARFETLKRLILVPDEFTVDSGEITPSFKVKRRVVEKKYEQQIEAVYAEAEKQGAVA